MRTGTMIRRVCATTSALLLIDGAAHAGTLSLSCELTAAGVSPACPATAPVYGVPGTYTYDRTLPQQSSLISGSDIGGQSVGFIDDYFFQIAAAQADAVSATINLPGNSFDVSGLIARIYSLAGNTPLVLTTPLGLYYTSTPSSSPLPGGATWTAATIAPVNLAAGSYILEIAGISDGTYGGSYTGSLNLAPVPLPAGVPLLLSGLGALAWLGRRRASPAV